MNRWGGALVMLFVGSGAAALIYEIVWLQMLQLVIGSSAVSVGLLLGVFMGGMCLGSLLLPRAIDGQRHPLRVYAALECTIAVCGLVLLAAIPALGRLYVTWAAGTFGLFLRALVAVLCLLPPTIAMGATLPAVARGVGTTRDGVEWLGWFYAGNIAGAVCGSLVAGFYLLRVYDMTVATITAVAINLLVAVGALVIARQNSQHSPSPEPRSLIPDPRSLISRVTIYVAIALSGFCALAGEVVWTRLLGLLFGATVYTFSIVLAVFLIGLGVGSACAAAFARSDRQPRLAFAGCQLLLVAAMAWTAHKLLVSYPYWPISPAMSPSIWMNVELDFLRALWALLPPALLWGASFPLALAALSGPRTDGGRLVGTVYAANTIGAVAGALAASLVLVAWLGSQRVQQLMMVASALAAFAALTPVFVGEARGLRRASFVVLTVGLVAAVLLVPTVVPLPAILVAYGRFTPTVLGQAGDMLYVGEGLTSSVAVSRLPNGRLGYHNAGKIQASSEPQDMRLQRMLGHLTTLVPRQSASVLVIGCGAGVTAGAAAIDPAVERLTIAEIEPLVPKVVSTYFAAQNHDVVHNPKVRIAIDDARHYLLTSRERFDAITSDPLDPWVKGAATLYTREFFETVKDHLAPGGVVTLFVQLYESNLDAVKSEVATFFEAFPDGIIAGNTFRGVGYDMVLLGQAGPPRIDLGVIDARIHRPEYAAVMRSLEEVGVRSTVDLFATYAGRAVDLKPWLADAAINRDSNLRLQYLAGLGLNLTDSDRIYGEILKYRRFPEDLFTGPEPLIHALRARMIDERPGG